VEASGGSGGLERGRRPEAGAAAVGWVEASGGGGGQGRGGGRRRGSAGLERWQALSAPTSPVHLNENGRAYGPYSMEFY